MQASLCPYCQSSNIKKEGKRKSKFQTIQKYFCKDCSKNFTDKKLEHKTYPARIILNAVSYFNLGYTQQQASKLISQRYKIKVPQRTISEWVNEYKEICTFCKLRNKAIKLYKPKNILFKQILNHIQPYTFKYHKAKLHLLFHSKLYNNQFRNIAHFYEPLKNYLEKISSKDFPHHIFTYDKNSSATEIVKNKNSITDNKNISISVRDNDSVTDITKKINENYHNKTSNQRASQIKFNHLEIKKLQKNNFACKLASLAINLAATNKERHESIQNFMLINDSTTIAIEIPIYLTNWDAGYYRNQKGFIFPLTNYQTPITGHIDILQIRNSIIHILDYKPDAKNQNPIEQLTIYALALSRKLNLPLYYFKCAWFDEGNYYEFFPLHAVYERKNK